MRWFLLGFSAVFLAVLLPEVSYADAGDVAAIEVQTVALLETSADSQILLVKFAHVVLFALGYIGGIIR